MTTTTASGASLAGLGRRARKAGGQGAFVALGLLGFVLFWQLVATISTDLPTPSESFATLRELLASPFHDNGPNDKGVGLQLWASLQRIFTGFGLAMLVAVPVGFAMGASKRVWSAVNPIVSLLRPVSPLAWFPIGLVIFKATGSAAVFVIFLTALWPTVINTAFGVANVPEDHRNVARVFKFSRYKYVRHVLLPHSLPSIVTGMKISMGIAWLVIVAVEMLAGGTGIGFFVWDSYNADNMSQVISAIFLIGAVGVVLDLAFNKLLRRVSYVENV